VLYKTKLNFVDESHIKKFVDTFVPSIDDNNLDNTKITKLCKEELSGRMGIISVFFKFYIHQIDNTEILDKLYALFKSKETIKYMKHLSFKLTITMIESYESFLDFKVLALNNNETFSILAKDDEEEQELAKLPLLDLKPTNFMSGGSKQRSKTIKMTEEIEEINKIKTYFSQKSKNKKIVVNIVETFKISLEQFLNDNLTQEK
jgi:hypothetical protein